MILRYRFVCRANFLNAYLEGSKVDTDNSVGGVGRERLESANLVGALHERVDQRWVRSEGGVDPENNNKEIRIYLLPPVAFSKFKPFLSFF